MTSSIIKLRRFLSRPTARARFASFLLGATLSALMLALYSRVASPYYVLGFVVLVPWLLSLERATSWREALVAGALMSASFVVWVFSWLPDAAERYAGASSILPWLALIAAAPLIEPQFLAFALVRYLVRRGQGRWPRARAAIAAASAYVGVELLVPKLFFDTLGQGIHPSPYLRQTADIAGVHGITLVLVLVNEAIAAARTSKRALGPLLAASLLVLVPGIYGSFRLTELESQEQEGPRVGIVQANITNYDKMRAEKGAYETVRTILDTHMALSEEIQKRHAPELLIWPETVYPTTFGSPRSEAGAEFDAEIRDYVRRSGAPLVFGAYDAEGEREFNAAFFVSPNEKGQTQSSSYRKTMLFPFTERVPEVLDSAWLHEALPWTGHWQPGPGARVIDLPLQGGRSIQVIPLICYDVLFPDFVATAARKGADLIVTLSNDSWFPDDRAPRLHLISAAFRSIETRISQVRATNNGISAIITPTGEIIQKTSWSARQVLSAKVPVVGRRTTPFLAFGTRLGPVLLAIALFVLLFVSLAEAASKRLRERGIAAVRGQGDLVAHHGSGDAGLDPGDQASAAE